jgi:hypothetical protein
MVSYPVQVEMINRLRKGGDPISQQDKHHSLYWGARHIYVCNARVSIAESLSAVLRLYYSRIVPKNLVLYGTRFMELTASRKAGVR